MSVKQAISNYLQGLAEAYAAGQGTEHSGRTALENLLNALKPGDVRVLHEPGRQADKGAPDFKLMKAARILGYIETKPPETYLRKLLKSNQIKRYIELSDNILLTDYLDWIWLRKGEVAAQVRLAWLDDLHPGNVHVDEERASRWLRMLSGFLNAEPEVIGEPDELATRLAVRARLLRDALTKELLRQQKENAGGRLLGLYNAFVKQVFAALKTKEFADAFAQTLAYALFLARLNAEDGRAVDLHNVKRFIPATFGLIRELAEFLDELERPEYAGVKWVVEEILSLINALDLAALHEALSFSARRLRRGIRAHDEEEARLFERDPYIYFYEDFLRAYDPKERETRGVYYTPPPVVNFIIRATDDILKRDFGLHRGLAEHEAVTVLDFACGTGTFLLEVMQRIFDNIGGPRAGLAEKMVHEHMLRHLYGFEFLIAPYTIAHLKLSQYLSERGFGLQQGERLRIYLTNTLEPVEPQANLMLPELTQEVEQAQEVKEKPVLVITGNPPYSGHSQNKGKWISALLDDYKQVDGQPLGEKNPKWLNDDYVKFIRFAQAKMDGSDVYDVHIKGVERGVVAVITNHSWLDNPTFRGMRRSLMNSFDAIYVLDLHGNTKKRERAPDGGVDQNVFDIQQGVAISIFVKNPDLPKKRRGVFHADLWGKRLDKYRALARHALEELDWQKLEPLAPFYLFIPQDRSAWAEYEKGWPLPKIFSRGVLGFQTHRDRFAIAFDKQTIRQRVMELRDGSISDDELRRRYGLKDNRDWKLKEARSKISSLNHQEIEENIIKCSYRPFDDRWCFFGYEIMDYPRKELLNHVAFRDNLCINIVRQTKSQEWMHVIISKKPSSALLVEIKDGSYVFPLSLYPNPDSDERRENIAPDFRRWLDERLGEHVPPEQIMAYAYAVLHAPTYRQRFAEFLRIDFPRLPFPDNLADFEALAGPGQALMDAHLMRHVPHDGLAEYACEGASRADDVVDRPHYDEAAQRLWINATTFFSPVPKEVWEFHIGGYQVLAKYLKDRKGRALSLGEIEQVTRIANVLSFTLRQMQVIDDEYRRIFGDGSEQ